MSGVRKRLTYKNLDLAGSHSSARMKFWGVCCIGGKAYKQVVNYRFHLTMAVLDPKSYDREARDRTVTLSVIQHGQIFNLAVLKHGEIQQVHLNLIFDKGDDVTFTVGGYGTVHLTGYQLIDSADCAIDMDNGHYCPVVELRSERRTSYPPVNGIGKEKLLRAMMGDSDDDDDDSDFSVKEDEIEESDEEEGEEDDDDDDDDIEIDEEEIKDVLEEVQDLELGSEVPQERKVEKSHKQMKMDNAESEGKDEVVCIEDNVAFPNEGELDSSIGHTPMPKKIDDSAKAKKKAKKRKRLSEVSSLGKNEKADGIDKSPKDKGTPKQKGAKDPVLKLEGGVEYQDVIVGRGPVAANGRMVSVFYMGRLENKTIFDARTAPKKPFTFKLGASEVIKGLDIGIKGMKVGGQRKLKIPPNVGYGSKGMSAVPANSTLFFTIELLSVN